MPKKLLLAALALASLGFASCSSLGYYFQAVRGQMEISAKQRPIADVLARADLNAATRAQLELVQRIRAFASRELALPDNRSYRSYADLGRDYVLWNVFAAPEFSNDLLQSCFPIAGCVQYRGFFDEQQARAHAAKLAAEGHDVYVGGVPAYSTLGWFDDPVLNTFVRYPEADLARLIFHELAHQVVYVKDDSTFNESFATAVEEEGLQRWIAAHRSPALLEQARHSEGRRTQFRALVTRYRARLAALYASDADAHTKRARKHAVFAELKSDYRSLIESWGESPSRSEWLKEELNNAHLASVATYTEMAPAFHALLAAHGKHLPAFYAAVKQLAAKERSQRLLR